MSTNTDIINDLFKKALVQAKKDKETVEKIERAFTSLANVGDIKSEFSRVLELARESISHSENPYTYLPEH